MLKRRPTDGSDTHEYSVKFLLPEKTTGPVGVAAGVEEAPVLLLLVNNLVAEDVVGVRADEDVVDVLLLDATAVEMGAWEALEEDEVADGRKVLEGVDGETVDTALSLGLLMEAEDDVVARKVDVVVDGVVVLILVLEVDVVLVVDGFNEEVVVEGVLSVVELVAVVVDGVLGVEVVVFAVVVRVVEVEVVEALVVEVVDAEVLVVEVVGIDVAGVLTNGGTEELVVVVGGVQKAGLEDFSVVDAVASDAGDVVAESAATVVVISIEVLNNVSEESEAIASFFTVTDIEGVVVETADVESVVEEPAASNVVAVSVDVLTDVARELEAVASFVATSDAEGVLVEAADVEIVVASDVVVISVGELTNIAVELESRTLFFAVSEVLEITSDDAVPFIYNCSLFPAPQYCAVFPGQRNEQSIWFVALTLPVLSVLPQ